MKNTIRKLLDLCTRAETILLTGPIFPDGDSIGACLALQELLSHKTNAQVDLTGKITFHYQWMKNIASFKADQNLQEAYDIAIVLDGDRNRLPLEVTPVFRASKQTVLIDHHSSTDPSKYDLALLDVAAASTCEIIYSIMNEWHIPLSQSLAEAIYTGIIFDTGGFRHSNTTSQIHRIAAHLLETGLDPSFISAMILMERQLSGLSLLEYCLSQRKIIANGRAQFAFISQEAFQRFSCTQGDIDGLVDTLLYVVGIELACLGIEQPDGRVKISLRSRADINVAQLAKSLQSDGGGHVRAAGAMLRKPLSEVMQLIPLRLEEAINNQYKP